MSPASRLVKLLLRMSGFKQIFGSEAGMRHFITYLRPRQERKPPAKLYRECHIDQYERVGRPIYHLRPRHSDTNGKHVLYLHGGAYVHAIVWLHWRLLERLMRATQCEVTVPLYGLGPEHSYKEAFYLLKQVYRTMLETHAPEDIVFMGDSSGGGMALAFAQMCLDEGLPQPGAVVMLSPWLDLTASNPQIKEVARRDPLLAEPGARVAARMWAGDDDLRLPLLSPINGRLSGLAPLCILIGTDDVLMPDCRLLRDKAEAEGQPLLYLEYQDMFHVWVLAPMPESHTALAEIVAFINDPRGLTASARFQSAKAVL